MPRIDVALLLNRTGRQCRTIDLFVADDTGTELERLDIEPNLWLKSRRMNSVFEPDFNRSAKQAIIIATTVM